MSSVEFSVEFRSGSKWAQARAPTIKVDDSGPSVSFSIVIHSTTRRTRPTWAFRVFPGGKGPQAGMKRDGTLGLFAGGNKTRKLEFLVADGLAREGRKGYIIAGGGSNALGGLGCVACAQEMQQQWFEQGLPFDRSVVGSGSSGTHGGLLAGFLGNRIHVSLTSMGVSRDPADQEPLVQQEGNSRPALQAT